MKKNHDICMSTETHKIKDIDAKWKKQAIEGRQYMRREYQSSHNLKGKNILFVHILLTKIIEF